MSNTYEYNEKERYLFHELCSHSFFFFQLKMFNFISKLNYKKIQTRKNGKILKKKKEISYLPRAFERQMNKN